MACEKKHSSKKKNVLYGAEDVVHSINVGNMILGTFKSKPDFIGQIDPLSNEQTTFQQMRKNSVKCALWLQKSYPKFSKNIFISICTCNQMLAYIPFLACLYIGGTVNPWDEEYFNDHIRTMYFLVEYAPQIIFIDSKNYWKLKYAIKNLSKNSDVIIDPIIITFDKIDDAVSLEVILNEKFDEAKIDQFFCEQTDPMNIMAVMFSSNATSYPGKMYIRHFAFMYPSNQEVPAMSFGDIGLWYGSLTWTYSLILTVRSIISYVTVIKVNSFNFVDEEMYRIIEKYKVKWVFLDSSICNKLFKTDTRMYNISSLKQFVYGDSNIRCNIHKQLMSLKNLSIIQVYSISEICIILSYQRNSNIISSGKLAKNVELTIKDIRTGGIVGSDKLGEIWYKLMCKWCNNKTCKSLYCCNYQAKKNNIDTNACAAVTSIRHCTNDYGFYRQDGEIFVVDKIKHLIKCKSIIFSPLNIENMLLQHPAVSEVIVRSVSNSFDGQLIAFVKKKDGAKVTEEELIKYVERTLPDLYKLHGVRFTTKMPYLPNGKIDRILVPYY